MPYTVSGFEGNCGDCKKPERLPEMIAIAERLSAGLAQVRVDFYEVDGKLYFGEYTFFSSGGIDTTITDEADLILGSKLVLPAKKKFEG